MKRPFVILVILVAAATWFSVAIIKGFPRSPWEAISPFLTAMPVASLLSFIYEHHLWHRWPLQRWLARTPDLRGAWRVTIHPEWVDQNTGKEPNPIQGYAQIDQSASSLCVRLFTLDSRSGTFAYSINEEQNEFRLMMVYENRPSIKDRPRKGTSHRGSAVYRFRGYRPGTMMGEYWTELKNIGDIQVHDRRRLEISSFEAGNEAFEQTRCEHSV